MTTHQMAWIIGVLAVLGLVAYGISMYRAPQAEQARTGSQMLTAEEVVDLEVQAQMEYEASGGTY